MLARFGSQALPALHNGGPYSGGITIIGHDGLIDVQQQSRRAFSKRASFLEYNINLNAILFKKACIGLGEHRACLLLSLLLIPSDVSTNKFVSPLENQSLTW